MSRVDYQMNDCVVTLPDGFTDSSVNVLEWALESGEKVALVVQREDVAEGASLEECVEKQTREYPAHFVGLQVDLDEARELAGGITLHRKAFRFKKERDVFYNHQVFVLDGRHLVVLTASARARNRVDVDAIVDEAVEGLRLRDR